MRLDRLQIAGFKNLRDFQIDFEEGAFTTVLVGRNGTGKSNLLEALVIIFRDLDLGAPPTFKYQLDYICRGHKVSIDADPERKTNRVKVTVDETRMPYTRLWARGDPSYLPNFVFGYYSGPSNRMETHFEKHQDRFYRDLLKGVERPLRPLFYARLVHSQFALLAFFSEQDEEMLHFLNEHLWIQGLDSVLFVMREPPWSSQPSEGGDPRFWNARGTVKEFLRELYKNASAPVRADRRVKRDFRRSTVLEHVYLYLKDRKALARLANRYSSQQEFFKALESTYISELISEVRVQVRMRNLDGSLTFGELSEGEQQLLMVLGLLRFTKGDEALLLLDEPDTHLNPVWSMQYVKFLEEVVGEQSTSHIILATHDPLTIASLERSQVRIMRRDEETGHIIAGYPEQDPRGMGIGGLLTSDVYGLRSQLDPYTLQLLDQKRQLAAKEEQLTRDEREELRRLNQQLEGLDFTKSMRDPMYQSFVKAMSELEREEGLQAPVLTEAERNMQKELAIEALRRIRDAQAGIT